MKTLKLVLSVIALLVIAGGLWGYWRYSELYPSTEDAYVGAHVVTVAAQTTGSVTTVHVVENQRVEAGTPLFDIDDALYRDSVATARAQVDAATQAESSLAAQLSAANAAVESANVANDAAQAQLARIQALAADGTAPQAQLDQATASAAQARAALDSARAQAAEAATAQSTNRDTLLSAQAQLQSAETNLARTRVVAPVAGWISNLSLTPGSVVSAYSPQFSMVSDGPWWIDANFKETDLPRIVEGLPVSVRVDLLPGVTLNGRVGSIARGSGATFALLPAENATGNWVRVVQRFAVRILLDDADPRLRVGASSTVTVDTTAQPAGDGR